MLSFREPIQTMSALAAQTNEASGLVLHYPEASVRVHITYYIKQIVNNSAISGLLLFLSKGMVNFELALKLTRRQAWT